MSAGTRATDRAEAEIRGASVFRSRFILANGPMLPPVANPAWSRLKRTTAWLAMAAAVLFPVVLAHRPLLTGIAHLFRVDDPAPSDAIVVLLGGPDHRPARAAELYQQGLAPVILLGHVPIDHELSEETLTRRYLLAHGVPPGAIHILPPVVESTRDEAFRVLEYVRAHPTVRRVTIVTSAFHSGRARWIFRRVLRGTGIDIRVAAARVPEFDETNWYTKDQGLMLYFGEAVKSVYYRLVF
jgi:uncharacterized SAM-binding protein YcdF (DUF218 family)